MSSTEGFIPVNRHLRISLNKTQQKTETGVLLPETFAKEVEKYQKVKLLSAAEDCNSIFIISVGKEAYVEKSMIQEINISGQSIGLILENYVVGVLH